MKLGVMQPYFFPYIGYWQLINVVDKYVIYDDVNYIKGGWINRNKILINGEATFLNLYLSLASPNKKINEIEIDSGIRNQKNLKRIAMAYKKAPYYEETYPLLEELLTSKETNLAKLNGKIIKEISSYLSMNTEFVYSSEIEKNGHLKGQERLLDICKRLGASDYYNAIGGKALYDQESFRSEGIRLHFLKTKEIRYKQFDSDFVPNLSIIDLLMFNGREGTKELLKCYTLEE